MPFQVVRGEGECALTPDGSKRPSSEPTRNASRHGCAPSRRRSRCCRPAARRRPGRARGHHRHRRPLPRDAGDLARVRGALRREDRGVEEAYGPWTAEHCCVRGQGRRAGRGAGGRRGLDHGHPPRAVAHAGGRGARRARRGARPVEVQPLVDWTERDVWLRIRAATSPTTRCTTPATPRSAARPARSPAPGREGRWAGHEKLECGMEACIPRRTHDRFPHLAALEAEAIHIMREVAAELERPVLLFSGGKDSIVLLRLAEKAFRPGASRSRSCTWTRATTSPEAIEFRDRRVAELGERLIVASVQDSIDRGRVVEETGPRASRNRLQTTTLLDAIAEHGFDAAFGGARRDEERARAKERVFSFRDDFGQWDPKHQRPELWNLYNGRHPQGRARPRVPALATGPSSTSGSTSRRRSSSCRRSTSPTSARSSAATGCSTPPPSTWSCCRRGAVRGQRALPHRRRHELHRRGGVARIDAGGRRGRDRRHAHHRARRDARRRPRHRGRDGGPQAEGYF